ncbi:hypothetical protein B296_00039805 [Ensete ventricosum]|uniref:Uncharacterized protein n=1 Tax=Ensete ventricosum TaxID=4639 RepID=A0A426X1W0_ENSVE|nr:hypothetical protein B296_00039805 [Ensete ventricosum]
MIAPTEEPKLEDTTLESDEKDMKEKPQSTAHTFHAPPHILDIDGFIKHQPVTILVDTRSSNDLMNDKRQQVTLCGDKFFLKCHIQQNQLWFLMQCSLILGYFHDFIEERTIVLKIFPDDDLGSTTHDRKKE